MGIAALSEIKINSSKDVQEFLKLQDAEESFAAVCDWIRDCFPAAGEIRTWLLPDEDVEDHVWVLIHFVVPPSVSVETLREQECRYYAGLGNVIPKSELPLFSVAIEHAEV